MKMIFRGDDLGISEGVNDGILKAIQDGVISCVGLMPNMESAKHGYQLIKDLDICLGQHTNICLGKPVCSPELIPPALHRSSGCPRPPPPWPGGRSARSPDGPRGPSPR